MRLTPHPPAPASPPPPPGHQPDQPTTTRREFTAALALTALGACVPRSTGTRLAAPAAAPSTPTAAAAGAPAPGATRPPDPVAEALMAVVVARHGADIVSAAERAPFRDAVARTLELSRRLRQTPVANGVDPFASLCAAVPAAATLPAAGTPAPATGRRAP